MSVFGWIAVGGLLALCATQWVGFDQWRPVAVLQAMTPYLLGLALPIGVAAAITGEWWMAAACVVVLATLAGLVAPAIRAEQAPGNAGEAGAMLSIFFGNLLAWNPNPGEAMAVVAATGADVLVLAEFNPDMHAALVAACGDRYAHRLEDVRPDPAGIALWSTVPFTGDMVPLSDRPAIDAVLDVDGRPLRVIGLHTEPPTMRARAWSRELRELGDRADEGDAAMPVVLLGDYNAARWHPSFRRLLARGWVTAHEWLGQWHSNSWANEGRALPLFVRIDHALLRGPVTPVRITDVPLPDSDHCGFVVTVSLG
ncbi:MAG: endonuclease/exonuclease/phosphatase family protein [Ilumatobacteraceae bacterium]